MCARSPLLMGAVALVAIMGGAFVAVSFAFVHSTAGESFIDRFACVPTQPQVEPGYPLYTRVAHLLTFVYLIFLVRSGVQILADHPRLYGNVHSTPGSEWLRLRRDVPREPSYTSKQDSVSVPHWLGLPGGRHTLGVARHWHFLFDILFVATGLAFVAAQFLDGTWTRLVPTTWELAPRAITCATTYGTFDDPATGGVDGYVHFNALQQLTYFGVIFVLAPLQVLTGIAMSPALANRFPRFPRLFRNRQGARSMHFILMVGFVGFWAGHVVLVLSTGALANLNGIALGRRGEGVAGLAVALVAVAAAFALTQAAVAFTWWRPRWLQRATALTVSPVMRFAFSGEPRARYRESDRSPYFWRNGEAPHSEEFQALEEGGFEAYRLKIYGLVERPAELSLAEIRALAPRQQQVTLHNCIQGWSGIAAWAGLPMKALMEHVRPLPGARYGMFCSFGPGAGGRQYYDSHSIEDLDAPLSLLAYEHDDAPLTVAHGAPLRLRVENQLGFKMVKWICAIEFVADYRERGGGQGGVDEDAEFFGYEARI